jgi:hypothetical protein
MRLVIFAAALLGLSSACALAGEEIMANYFGNTVVATGQLGTLKVHYKPNHTFSGRAEGPTGAYDLRGTWELDAQGNLCRKYSTNGTDLPPGTPNPYCAPAAAHNIGDTWSVTQNGRTAQVTLVAGKK